MSLDEIFPHAVAPVTLTEEQVKLIRRYSVGIAAFGIAYGVVRDLGLPDSSGYQNAGIELMGFLGVEVSIMLGAQHDIAPERLAEYRESLDRTLKHFQIDIEAIYAASKSSAPVIDDERNDPDRY